MKVKTILNAWVFIVSIALLTPVWAEEEEETPVPATIDELIIEIENIVAESDLVSVGIALVDRSGPLWVGSIGKADVENDIDADADTMYRIGSTSKMFASLSVLKLVEEGRLSLDDKLADLAPEIEFDNEWEDTHPVRVVHLLEHTTGWDDIHLPEYAHSDPDPVTLKAGLDYHPHSRVSRWKPGSRMAYCNAGPPVAAYIVEKVTGEEYEAYVQENFFDPLGMATTTYRYSDTYQEKGAILYAGGEPQPYWHIIMRPSGSINASPADMAKFVLFYLNRGAVNGEPLVSEASLKRMESVASTPAAAAGQVGGYGLSNYTSSHDSWIYRAHNGGVTGGASDFSYMPQAGFGYSLLFNSDDFQSMRKVMELVRDFQTQNLEPPEKTPPVSLQVAHHEIEGFYYPINSRQQVSYFLDRVLGARRLKIIDNMLDVKPVLDSESDLYYPVGDNLYAAEETGVSMLSSVIDPLAGDVVHIGTLVYKPAPATLVYGQLAIGALWLLSIASSIVYFLVWGVRRWRGKLNPGPTIRIRQWPLLAGLSIIVVIMTFMSAISDPIANLSAPNLITLTIFGGSIAFAVFAVLGVSTAINSRHIPMNRVNYWYSTVMSFTHLVVAAYFTWFGAIGLMTWA